VSGDAVNDPQNVYVPVGTSLHDIIDAVGGLNSEDVLLIAGGPMMGRTVPNDKAVVMPQNNGLTILKNVEKDEVKCLRCGRCTETCPSGLMPVRIAQALKTNNVDLMEKLYTMDCIECGLCTYICPSKIDVTENVRRAKKAVMARRQANGGKK